jgi:hypothetical protein
MTTFVEKGIKLADAYRRHGIKVTLIFYLCPIKICDILRFVIAVLQIWIRIQIRIHRIHMFLGLLDPDPGPIVRYGSGPGSGSRSFFHQAKIVIKTFIPTAFSLFIFENDTNVPPKSNKQLKH